MRRPYPANIGPVPPISLEMRQVIGANMYQASGQAVARRWRSTNGGVSTAMQE